MKFIYHYHLIRPRKNGDQNHFFGVLHRTGPIDSVEEYSTAIQFSLLSATPT